MNHDKSWLDERINLGEVPDHLAADAAKRRAEAGFDAARSELTESDRQILSQIPSDRFAAEVIRRAESAKRIERARRSGPSRAAWGGACLAACLAFAFVVVKDPGTGAVPAHADPVVASTGTDVPEVPPPQSVALGGSTTTGSDKPIPSTSEWRTKGTIELGIQRESPDGLKAVTNSDTLDSGARLRLSVPTALAWAAVYYIDAKGEMAQHWPMQGSKAEPLPQGLLPRAWELDDAAGSETFVLVWSDKPFGLDAVRKAIFLRRNAPKVARDLHVSVVEVRKAPGTRP